MRRDSTSPPATAGRDIIAGDCSPPGVDHPIMWSVRVSEEAPAILLDLPSLLERLPGGSDDVHRALYAHFTAMRTAAGYREVVLRRQLRRACDALEQRAFAGMSRAASRC